MLHHKIMPRFITRNEKETRAIAARFAACLKGGDVVLLQGELGAGKTVFVKGLAKALGVKEQIKSPTFVLVHQHRIKNKGLRIKHLIHCDAYRVKNPRELLEAGLADWLGRPDALVIVEWGEKIRPLLKGRKYKIIKFKHGKKRDERIIKWQKTLR